MTAPDLIATRLDEAEARPERPVYRVRPMCEVIADGKAHVAERTRERMVGLRIGKAIHAERAAGASVDACIAALEKHAADLRREKYAPERKRRETARKGKP